MRNPEKMLSSLAKHSVQQEYKYERLYRLLYNQEMYLKAYQKIYAKPGNLTPPTATIGSPTRSIRSCLIIRARTRRLSISA